MRGEDCELAEVSDIEIFTPGIPRGPPSPGAPFFPGSPGSPLGPGRPDSPSYLATGGSDQSQSQSETELELELTHLALCLPSDLSDLADQTDLLFPGNIVIR